jgi:hypothetical protein
MFFIGNNLFFIIASAIVLVIITIAIVALQWDIFFPQKSELKTLPDEKSITWILNNNTGTHWSKQEENITLIADVPFTSQAPFENWGNSIYEEWCEEASVLMAIYWERGIQITDAIASEEIREISDFEEGLFWVFHDTSLFDTAKVMEKYFSFTKYTIKEDIQKSDIIQSLKDNRILLVPVYGRDLHNIHYTPPWPIPHMLVIVWYDPGTMEFITNDPGTKHGERYRYDEDILFDAIWLYPTSSEVKLPPPEKSEIRKKAMLEVYK